MHCSFLYIVSCVMIDHYVAFLSFRHCRGVTDEHKAMWVSVIKSIYGTGGVMGDLMRSVGGSSGILGGIVRVGWDIDRVGVWFSSSFTRKVGDGSCVSFWDDIWVGGVRLRDLFHRLYHLDRCKEVKVAGQGIWGDNGWNWVWDWVREPRGRVVGKLIGLEDLLSHVNLTGNDRDARRWDLDEDGCFSVKALSSLVDDKILNTGDANFETVWNNLIQKKIKFFSWRTLRCRLPVRVELDRKGIDLHSLLCPWCDDACESIDHAILLCTEVMKVWSLVFGWWKHGNVNAFTAYDTLSHNGNGVVSSRNLVLWQAVIWTTGYFIWRNRNYQVFGKRVDSHVRLFQDIQLKSYEWIMRRSKKYKLRWSQWVEDPGSCLCIG
ncbi:RNA-directed DNA polymerase, eukaryota, reverse transcriptase zinc-binding domain protein [Tanacetum coccineum]